jgi:hypothetical protein
MILSLCFPSTLKTSFGFKCSTVFYTGSKFKNLTLRKSLNISNPINSLISSSFRPLSIVFGSCIMTVPKSLMNRHYSTGKFTKIHNWQQIDNRPTLLSGNLLNKNMITSSSLLLFATNSDWNAKKMRKLFTFTNLRLSHKVRSVKNVIRCFWSWKWRKLAHLGSSSVYISRNHKLKVHERTQQNSQQMNRYSNSVKKNFKEIEIE